MFPHVVIWHYKLGQVLKSIFLDWRNEILTLWNSQVFFTIRGKAAYVILYISPFDVQINVTSLILHFISESCLAVIGLKNIDQGFFHLQKNCKMLSWINKGSKYG